MRSSTHDYYLKGEHYDWNRDPKALEKFFHTARRRNYRFLPRVRTLDIGCGTGFVTRLLSSPVALDLNLWNLRRIDGDIDRVQASGEFLPFRVGTFPFVVCTEMLEHVDDPEKVLRQILSVLKPGGRLVGSVPSNSWLWKLRRYLSVTHPHTEPFHHNYSRREIREMLKAFSNLTVRLVNGGMIILFSADN